MSVVHLNKSNFDLALNSEKIVLLDFYASWCVPCSMLSPIIEEVAEENPQYFIGKINIDEEPELAQEFNVSSIPTLVILKDGKVINQSVGARPKAKILEMLEG